MNHIEISDRLRTVEEMFRLMGSRGLVHRTAEDERADGRTITLDGVRCINFGSCSYLGLETDARLREASCEAVQRYGTQFASSRAYVSTPLYVELQALLGEMVGGRPLVVTQTTSLGHLATLPVIVGERDAVLFDIQVHASVQAVLPTLRLLGVPCEFVQHNRLDRVEARAAELARTHRRVFYLCDGVYSMHGDLAPVDELFALLDRQPQLWAYVDDAHGVGWAGRHGAGVVVGRRGIHERMVVALSLAKGFASSGAALVFADSELARRVFTCGSTLIFSGPLQPALLGAAIASAKIHLSDELVARQSRVRERIELLEALLTERGIGSATGEPSPIRFVHVGHEERALDVAARLLAAGYYVNVSAFPAVPRRRAGLRIVLNAHHELDDVRGLVAELAPLVPRKPS